MSADRHVTLLCDYEGCHQWTGGGTDDVREERRIAKREGWTYDRAAGDRCQVHKPGTACPEPTPRQEQQ